MKRQCSSGLRCSPWTNGSLLVFLLALLMVLPVRDAASASCRGIWLCPDDLRGRPVEGPAWAALLRAARKPAIAPQLSDKDDNADVWVLARALVYARTGDEVMRNEVIAIVGAAMGSQLVGTTLAIARNLLGYVIAADIVGLPPDLDVKFRRWLQQVVNTPLAGRTIRSTHNDRPNNWGTHAGASRLAVALYLGDQDEVQRAAAVFHGWLGNRAVYAGFRYGALDWQARPDAPVAINPAGAERNGHPIDGILPDDQRRCCAGFMWPAPKEPYVYEALQGALAQAVMLSRLGYDVWSWEDRALLRAYRWLHEVAGFPAEGDDTWQPYLVNHYYCTAFPVVSPSRPGKAIGFTDWTHPPCPKRRDGRVH